MSYTYRYVRHTSTGGNEGFDNGDPLVAADLNKIEIALKEHDSALAGMDETLEHVLSGINVISTTQIRTMLAAAESAAAAAAAAQQNTGNDDSGNDDSGDDNADENDGNEPIDGENDNG